jgi:tetratricopeptide (TPR) repeat protein
MWPATTATIELGPLEELARATLAEHLAARTPAIAVPSVSALAANIGTPSLAYHMARFLSEGGAFEDDTISLADIIAARLRLLPHSSLVLCQTAAAFGREAPAAALMACTQLAAGGTFETALAICRARGYLFEEDGVVGFSETIVRDVAYDATPHDVRRQLHKNIVTALRAEVTDTATLGHHHALAGDRDDAAALLLAAGDEATHQLDDVTASRHYQRGLAAARELMLAEGGLASQRLFAMLSLRLATSLRAGGALVLARGVLYEAVAHCDRGSMSAAEIAGAAAAVHAAEGDVDQAIDSARRAIGELIPHGRRDLLADLYVDLSRLHLERGDATAALAELTEGFAVVTGGGSDELEPPHNLWRLLLRTAQLRASVGELPEAIRVAEAALSHADRASSRQGQASAHAVCAQLYRRVPNDPMTHRHRQAAIAIRRTLGDRRGTAELLLEPPASRERVHEALTIALEVGWLDGATRAQRQLS